jgi:pimeloyl-ACP methyl ester carboxylesterase
MGLGFPKRGTTPEPVDTLQISGALMAPSDGPSPVELADAGHAPHGLGIIRDQYERKVRKNPTIRMRPGSMRVEGRLLQFAVSDNVGAYGPDGPGSPPIWAVNVHGYFAGGGMYWRESARLAEQLGWRVINPSLPGFGGSDPLDWHDLSMEMLANQIVAVLHQVEAGPVVVLGHSMGGAVAVQFVHDHPRHTLGLIYRDGVSTPAWKQRHGIVSTVVAPFAPNLAPLVDLGAAAVSDLPDLFIGRMFSTVRSVLPEVRRNVRTAGQTLPVGSLLMAIDQRSEVRALAAQEMPILTEWGCFDRITPAAAAAEFAGAARAPVQWMPGGHSWMLARPQGQSDVLTHLAAGKEFMARVESRWRRLTARSPVLRAVNEWG